MTSHTCTHVSVNPVERESNNEVQALDLRHCCSGSTDAVFVSFPIRGDGNAGSGRCERRQRLTVRCPAGQGRRTWWRRLPRWRSAWRRRAWRSRRVSRRSVSRRSGRSTRRGRGRRLRRQRRLLCHHLRSRLPILRRRRWLLRRRSLSRRRRGRSRRSRSPRRSGSARRRSSRCSPWRWRRASSLTAGLSVAARFLCCSHGILHAKIQRGDAGGQRQCVPRSRI